MVKLGIEEELHRLCKHASFKEFMWDKYKIERYTGVPIWHSEEDRWFCYMIEDNGVAFGHIQLIGYMLDYLYTVQDNKVFLYMGSDIEDKFVYLVDLITLEEIK